MEKYDIIILGGGGAGLNCALELIDSNKSILIIEKELKKSDDRTWSYWEKGPGKFDHIVSHVWNNIHFHADSELENVSIAPYQYKMIRSSDFYAYAYKIFNQADNINRIQDEVIGFSEFSEGVSVKTTHAEYQADRVLDSISIPKIDKTKHQYVAQHFGGWFIETEEDSFDPDVANLMDFRIPQENDARFFYVLPTSKRKALIEIAIFSNDILTSESYDKYIQDYINEYMNIGSYKILEKEIGVIPMTAYPFHKNSTERIIKIGTAGGWVKPSSGYAFTRMVERSESLARQLKNNTKKIKLNSSLRHRWMDKTMLKAWNEDYISAKEVFESLFSKRKPSEVFEFLDEKSSLFQEFRVMYSCPIIPLTKAAIF